MPAIKNIVIGLFAIIVLVIAGFLIYGIGGLIIGLIGLVVSVVVAVAPIVLGVASAIIPGRRRGVCDREGDSGRREIMERQVARVEYVNGCADAYDARGVMLSRQRCDKLVGYGPDGFVVMRGNCYWIHKANGCNAVPPMIPYNFEKKKWDMHDSYLRIMC